MSSVYIYIFPIYIETFIYNSDDEDDVELDTNLTPKRVKANDGISLSWIPIGRIAEWIIRTKTSFTERYYYRKVPESFSPVRTNGSAHMEASEPSYSSLHLNNMYLYKVTQKVAYLDYYIFIFVVMCICRLSSL